MHHLCNNHRRRGESTLPASSTFITLHIWDRSKLFWCTYYLNSLDPTVTPTGNLRGIILATKVRASPYAPKFVASGCSEIGSMRQGPVFLIRRPEVFFMAAESDVFERIYRDYLRQLAAVDLRAAAEMLGGRPGGDVVVMPFFGSPYKISAAGISDPSGNRPSHSVIVLLSKYLWNAWRSPDGRFARICLRFPAGAPCDAATATPNLSECN